VLEADAFGKFLEDGILNPETGIRFRKEILSVGNSVDPMEAYVNFRGRKPTLEAYLKRAGMIVTDESRKEFGGG
jgi:Zn-dependent oligopeptidase